MKENIRLAVLGGDRRQIYMTQRLLEAGYEVSVWGLGEDHTSLNGARVCNTWETALESSEAVILPLPASVDGVRIHTPLREGGASLRIDHLIDHIGERLLLGGRISEPVRAHCQKRSVRCIDYYESELLQLKNALPTAEGAISIAMQSLPITLDGATAAVLGYGRIGSLLAARLWSLGADVTVYARRQEALTAAQLSHHKTARLRQDVNASALTSLPEGCRVVFNTIPQRLLSNETLDLIPQNCLYIDLASAPGGIDHSAAAAKGLQTLWATALPGKYAPETAGFILGDVMLALLEESD